MQCDYCKDMYRLCATKHNPRVEACDKGWRNGPIKLKNLVDKQYKTDLCTECATEMRYSKYGNLIHKQPSDWDY